MKNFADRARHALVLLLGIAGCYGFRANADPLGEGAGAAARGDRETAIRLLSPLTDQGSGAAAVIMGNIYAQGIGGPKTPRLALKWYRFAIIHGALEGANRLGLMFRDGDGVRKNMIESMKWYRYAANRGYSNSQFNLGMIYADEESGFANYVEAYKWLILAGNGSDHVSSGWDPDSFSRGRLEKKMTVAQIEEARQMAKAWKRQH